MSSKVTEFDVTCFQLIPSADPMRPTVRPMRPSPMERFTGRFGRREDRRKVRTELTAKGHSVHSINWGDNALVVYIWAMGGEPSQQAAPPAEIPPKVRRTATSRRHAPRPETRKKR